MLSKERHQTATGPLVRTDIPRTQLNVDFDFLERKLDNPDEFSKLFGITTVSDASAITAKFPYSITELGQKLGGKYWHVADKLMKIVERDTGIDIKTSDGKFHHRIKVNNTVFDMYSDDAFDLLQKKYKQQVHAKKNGSYNQLECREFGYLPTLSNSLPLTQLSHN